MEGQQSEPDLAFSSKTNVRASDATLALTLERVKGIEPSYSAWEADVLPLNYTRNA